MVRPCLSIVAPSLVRKQRAFCRPVRVKTETGTMFIASSSVSSACRRLSRQAPAFRVHVRPLICRHEGLAGLAGRVMPEHALLLH
jgi:hypothetical protein